MQFGHLVTNGPIRSENSCCIKLIEMVVKSFNQLKNSSLTAFYILQSVHYNTIGSFSRKSFLRPV